jgi:hypothetical protein
MNTKEKNICFWCKEEKNLSEFSKDKKQKNGLNIHCRECIKKKYRANKEKILSRNKKYRDKNKEKIAKQIKEYQKDNKYKISQRSKKRYSENKEKILKKNREYYSKNKEKVRSKQEEYYCKNKNKVAKRAKEYREENIEKMTEKAKKNYIKHKEKYDLYRKENKKYWNDYDRKRRSTDINFKLKKHLRSRIYGALKDNYKSGSAIKDLGCSVDELKKYLESKFQPGMTWENYGKFGWHVDHVMPLCTFTLSDREQFLKACHYTNLQPLWWYENLSKRKGVK